MEKESLITQEARAMIGVKIKPVTGKVYEKEIQRFCYAVGDLNPAYLAKDGPDGGGNAGIVAPPMFYDIPSTEAYPLHRLKADGLPEGGRNIPLNTTRTMAGGKEVEFFKPMQPGDDITRSGRLVEIYEKEGRSGPLVFSVFEYRYTNQDGDLVAIEKITGIHR